jgi:hypothetical protein
VKEVEEKGRMERKIMNTENRFLKTRIALVGVAVALAAAFLLLVGLTKPSQAATGDILRTINVNPGTGCSTGVGIAFDGSELLTSCAGNQTITRVDPSTGNNLGSYEVSGTQGEGLGAISWDAENNQLWMGTLSSPERIYKVMLDKGAGTGQATLAFEIPAQVQQIGLTDGLAYDGTDNTLWYSTDIASTLYHFDQAGNVLGSIPNLNLGGFGNSGIVVANADTLYLANNGGGQIYSAKKDGSSVSLFASLQGKRVEDLECDNQTFSGKSVIWSKDAHDDELNAFEVPEGQCAQGGVVDPPPPTCTFSEILPPVNNVSSATDAGMSSYKFGSRGVIPAKFQVTCDNDPIDTQAEADARPMTLTLTKLGSTPAEDTVVEQTQTGSANTGNLFRFVDADDHYIYNVGVKGLEAGTYKLTISEANGGGSHDEWFSIE